MHHLLIPAIELVLGGAALAWSKSRGREPEVTVEWTGSRTVILPLGEVRRAIAQHLAERACTAVRCTDEVDVYRRGNPLVARVPCERDLRWDEIPAVIATAYGDVNGKTFFQYKACAVPIVEFSPAGREFFLRRAQAEFEDILALLELLMAERAGGRRSGNGRPRHRWYPEDEEAQSAHEAPPDGSLDADLALLGLKRGATLEQVTKAYRVACHKYHPDRLAGKNVEPHLVELAVQRFKEVTDAYRRLRDRIARHQQA